MNTEEIMRAELGEGEHLIWSGGIKSGLAFGLYDFFLIPFTGLYLAITIMWEAGAIFAFWQLMKVEGGALLVGMVFPIVGLFVVLFAASFFIGRFFISAFIRSKTTYGLTNQRILIGSRLIGKRPRTVPFSKVKELELNRGSGSIYFSGSLDRYIFGTISKITGYPMSSFERIENAPWVYDQLNGLVNASRNEARQ